MKYIAIIPARYASTRFPGKPLAILDGKPIIQHVYQRVASCFEQTVVATDDQRILSTIEAFGGKAVMTSADHRSGTDRCYEAFCKLQGAQDDIIVNVQGDEPFIDTTQLEAVKACFDDPETEIATLVKPFARDVKYEVLANPNSPKVVIGEGDYALYFSRSVIPYLRGIPQDEWSARHEYLRHIGLYAYRAQTLKRITELRPGRLETVESLEQLRWLEAGIKIKVARTDIDTIGIDTPEDLERATAFLKQE